MHANLSGVCTQSLAGRVSKVWRGWSPKFTGCAPPTFTGAHRQINEATHYYLGQGGCGRQINFLSPENRRRESYSTRISHHMAEILSGWGRNMAAKRASFYGSSIGSRLSHREVFCRRLFFSLEISKTQAPIYVLVRSQMNRFRVGLVI